MKIIQKPNIIKHANILSMVQQSGVRDQGFLSLIDVTKKIAGKTYKSKIRREKFLKYCQKF